MRPADPFRARPRIYVGGESEPARALVAAHGDVWFINGQPHDDVARLIADVSARPRPVGQDALRFGLSAFVIARETQAQAEAHLEHLFALAELDKPLRERQKANIDPKIRAKDLSEAQLSQIVHAIQDGKYVIEGDLSREIDNF